jgi:hypothetical protein
MENSAYVQSLSIQVMGGTATTTNGTGAVGLLDFLVMQHDGANGLSDITANGVVMTVRARVSGSTPCIWHLDEDGDTWQRGSITCQGPFYLDIGTDDYTINKSGENVYHTLDPENDTAGSLIRFEVDGGSALTLSDNIVHVGAYITNANMTYGVSIYQGAADNEILAFKSSDVAHGMTALAETDTYGMFRKIAATLGGVSLRGFGEGNYGAQIVGACTTADTGKGSGDFAAVLIDGSLKSGTGQDVIGANGNVVAMRNLSTTLWILDAEGDTWQSGSITMEDNIDSAATTDQVVLGAYDLSAGNRALAISQEAAVAAETDETKFSNKLPVRINGTTYYIMLTTT